MRLGQLGLLSIAAVYVLLGLGYAAQTPLWQNPDEPAHFNYIAQLDASPIHIPWIEPADYPYAELEALKAAGFPEGAPVDGLRYEDHQPPLYYLLALPVYRATGPGQAETVHALRWLGLAFGVLTILLAYTCSWIASRGDEVLSLSTAGFVAFLPMHLSLSAAVNNDALAIPLMAAILALALVRLRDEGAAWLAGWRYPVLGGCMLGLAVWTKASILAPAAGVLLAADWMAGRPELRPEAARRGAADRGDRRPAFQRGSLLLGLAFVIALPWILRNQQIYGLSDPLGLGAHAQVVSCMESGLACQPTTRLWIAEHGLPAFLRRMAVFTFASFWGVFGWMGVFMTELAQLPVYPVLAAFSGLGLAGLALRRRARAGGERVERQAMRLMALAFLLSLAGFLWYNLSFVQHQGRYLFSAIVPVAFGIMAGWQEILDRLSQRLGAPISALGNLGLLSLVAGLAVLARMALERFIVPALGGG